jgi:S-adenosylmethionine/arginine decarboxylase-like enzyme
MVDIKNVDGAFLNSEHRLATAMIDVVNQANLTLLSYHCHGMQPSGVSCAGILFHHHFSFHTWPDDGVITLDLIAGSGLSIMPVLPVIEKRFGVAVAKVTDHDEVIGQPSVRWAHKLRGFRHHPTKISNLFQMTDLGRTLVSILGTEYKEEVTLLDS